MFDLRKTLIPLKRIFLTSALFIAVTAVGVFGARDAKAAVIDLGFALDESGSIGSGDFRLAAEALAAALGVIPTSGTDQYNVGVVSFASTARNVFGPALITNAAELTALQNTVKTAPYSSGGTNIGNAINLIVSNFGDISASSKSLMNITTDGVTSDQGGTTAAAGAAAVAGWDGLSFEAVGGGTDDTYMNSLAFPNVPNPSVIIASGGAIPDPAVQGFVLQVFDFKSGDYERAIAAKVKAIVRPPAVPVPAAVWLFGTALLGFIGVSRRRKVA